MSSFFYRRRSKKKAAKKKKVAGFMPEIQEELWELIIKACVSDLRFLAILGYDAEIREVLEDPVLMDSKYIEESPLLPGEVALVIVNDKDAFLKKFQDINEISMNKINKMREDSSVLFNQLNLNFIESLDIRSLDEVFYTMYLRTSKIMCVVVLNMTFSKVLAVSPVFPELQTKILDVTDDTEIRTTKGFEKIRCQTGKSK